MKDYNALSLQYGRLAPPPKRWVFQKSISLTYRLADARIAVSSGVADDLAAMGGLPRADISVVHNPILYRPASPADLGAVSDLARLARPTHPHSWEPEAVEELSSLDPRL